MRPGDTILLEAGATFVGNFILPLKSGGSTRYITIRSAASDAVLPAAGVRMTPAYAPRLPMLRSPNSKPALTTAPGAHHYRLQFLEFGPNATFSGSILGLGVSSSIQNTLAAVPRNLIVDQVYMHGDYTLGQVRGISLHSASTDIVNSYISNIKATGDAQAIAGSNGPGPYRISNNYLEAAGQNIQIGASAPLIPGLVPSGITLKGNHITKPLAWRSEAWSVRSLLDLRSVRRVVIEGNLLENSWAAGSSSFAINLIAAPSSSTGFWSVLQDIEFRSNVVRRVGSAITIARSDPSNTTQVSDIGIRNNLFDAISAASYGGAGQFLSIAGAADVTVDHNTIFNDGTTVVLARTYPTDRFVFTNNILTDRGAAIDSSVTTPGLPTISKFFPTGQFAGGIYVRSNPLLYPTSNYYPATLGEVGFVSLSTGDYRLSTNSIYRYGGTDGKDPGCNFSLLPKVPK